MNPPRDDSGLPRRIEAFRHNMQLLFHNKFTEKKGIQLQDIIPMYYRFFVLNISPRDIVRSDRQCELTSEFDWATAVTLCEGLKPYFKLNTDKTCLLLKQTGSSNRTESEMISIAQIANFENLNACSYQQLINLVVYNFDKLPTVEKVVFKEHICQHLNINPDADQNLNVSANGPIPQTDRAFVNPFVNFPGPIPPLPPSINGVSFNLFNATDNLNSEKLLEEIMNSNIQCNGNKGIPNNSQSSEQTQQNGRKRRPSSQSADLSEDNLSKKSKSSIPEPNALPHIAEEPVNVNGDTPLNPVTTDANHNSSVVNVDTGVIRDNVAILPEKTVIQTHENGIIDTSERNNVADAVITENGIPPVATHSYQSSNHINNFFHRPTNDLERKICDNMANLKEFSQQSDGRLDPNQWVIFQISKKELGHYRGREKLNCQAKSFDLQSKSWKLHGTRNKKLRLPNKTIVYGEFVLENGETYFEIIDCLQCRENSDLLNSPFDQRYKKAEEIILQLVKCTVEGIPVRMKPYFTIDNLAPLSYQMESENTRTVLLVHNDIYGFKNPRLLTCDTQVSLEKLLKEQVFMCPGAIDIDVDDIAEENVPNSVANADISLQESNEVTPAPINDVLVNIDTHDADDNNENVEIAASPSQTEFANLEISKDLPLSQHNNGPLDIQLCAEFHANELSASKIIVPPIRRIFKSTSVNHLQKHCTIKCVDVDLPRCRMILSNPFAFCIYFGWERILKGRNITYISPCGKVFDTYKKVMDYLIRTDFSFRTIPNISIDYFTFENEIRDYVEFPVWNLQVINENISNDMEKVPITCVNEIDKEVLPEFTYIVKSTTGNNVTFPLFDIGNECICTDDCQSNCCSCVTDTTKRHTKGFVSSVCKAKYKGYDFRRLYRCVPRGIYECNFKCKCSDSENKGVYCGNRVIQNPIKWKLQVFRKPDGWGLRTLHDIPKGHFVCQFIGRIVLEEEAANGIYKFQVKLGPVYDCPYKNCRHQSGDETLNKNNKTPMRSTRGRHVCLNAFENQNLFIDATHEGNVGRFINHEPKSNTFMQTVFIEELHESRPHIGFFAKENILAGKEITANFSAVRNGINETALEKDKEALSQRPGPKRATGKGDQNVRGNDRHQSSQSQVLNNTQANGAYDNDQWTFPNLPSLPNLCVDDDVLSQGSSRSSNMSYSNPSSSPVVRLEKINIDQVLKTHKLTRSQNSPSETTTENLLPAQIKTEPLDVSNIKQEIVKIEVCGIKIEKSEDENPFPHMDIKKESEEILGLPNADNNNSEMIVDNPEMTVNNSETAINSLDLGNENNSVEPNLIEEMYRVLVGEKPEILIDLTEDSDDNPGSQEDVVILNNDIKIEKRNQDLTRNFREIFSSQENRTSSAPNVEEGPSTAVMPLDFSRTPLDFSQSLQDKSNDPISSDSESSTPLIARKTPTKSKPPTKSRRPSNKSMSQSQSQQPSTSRALVPASLFSSEHTVKECMQICCIHNPSGFPDSVSNNKLFRCRVYGFERKIEAGSVFYETPCGKMFVDEQSIFEFLLEAEHPSLTVDNFCFNPEVECSPSVWMNEQCFDLDQNTCTVSEDITNGEELIPIRCRSSDLTLEFPELPSFRYIAQYEHSEQYRRESLHLPENCCCSCEDGCLDPVKCLCMRRTTFRNELHSSQSTAEKLRISHGYRFRKLMKPDFNGIFECGDTCLCFNTCSNRVVQNDIAWSLEVFNTQNTGWGVRTLQDIPQGAFVCNFVGLVKVAAEAESGDKQYQVKVTLPKAGPHLPSIGPKIRENRYVIDATRQGNLGRFINHSCAPNMFPQTVFVAHPYMKVAPYVSFFANQDIVATTELTFDYTGIIEDQSNGMIACFCGASNCKERFLCPESSP